MQVGCSRSDSWPVRVRTGAPRSSSSLVPPQRFMWILRAAMSSSVGASVGVPLKDLKLRPDESTWLAETIQKRDL